MEDNFNCIEEKKKAYEFFKSIYTEAPESARDFNNERGIYESKPIRISIDNYTIEIVFHAGASIDANDKMDKTDKRKKDLDDIIKQLYKIEKFATNTFDRVLKCLVNDTKTNNLYVNGSVAWSRAINLEMRMDFTRVDWKTKCNEPSDPNEWK